jgi:DNA-binding CsgD family transcriptional regulator/tetratricopeptide (TPR) repeat protein
VLILDGLHLADRATVALLDRLVGRLRVVAAVTVGRLGSRQLLERLSKVGFETLVLAPLAPDDAERLLDDRHPDLAGDVREHVLACAAGNPFLLEELPRQGNEEWLRRVFEARVAGQSATARQALARLTLLGRPIPPELLGQGAAEVVEAGLAVVQGERISLRHELVGEAARAGLSSDEAREIHADLARRLEAPSDTAGHLAAAGHDKAARQAALRAAGSALAPGERAEHLAVAARCSRGVESDHLRVRAARALLEAGRHEEAGLLAEMVSPADPELAAQAAVCVARAAWHAGNPDRAERTITQSMGALPGKGGAAEIELRIELARLKTFARDGAAALPLAEHTWRAAQRAGAHEAAARLVLAHAHVVAFSEEAMSHYRAALEAAARSGREATELEAGAGLIEALQAFGHGAEAYTLVGRFVDRARQLRLHGWEWQLRHLAAHLELFHRGSYTRAIAEGQALLEDRPALGERVSRAEANLALALADVGRDAEARALLREASRAAFTPDSQAALLWARSEVDLLAGRPHASLDRTAECLGLESPFRGLAIQTACWASLEAGTPPPPALDSVEYAVIAGAKAESRALVELMTGGSPGDAATLFEQAAAEWSGRSLRSELRCLWGGGEAARRAADPERAQALLLAVEHRAEAHGLGPLAGRIQRSLRGAGIVRSGRARRARRGLTARERETLALVRHGLSSREIGTRLGIGRATVDSHVKSAMAKLEMGTRKRAASLVFEEGGESRAGSPPLIVVDPTALDHVVEELRHRGYTIRAGFALPPHPWQLGRRRLALVGTAGGGEDAARAVAAAARGAAVAIGADIGAEAVLARLAEDLGRIGPVDWRLGAGDPLRSLDPVQRSALELLADGASVGETARTLGYAPRTVNRKLAAARAALGVETTAEAVLLVRGS